jgi:cold shock CspA family protein
MLAFMAFGTVAFWHGDEGWGAIKAPDRPGLGFVHFMHIQGVEGYRELMPGQDIEFEWADDLEQDGCQWRVAWVRPIAPAPGR